MVSKFVSYKPEPGAWATDAFFLNWHSLQFYAFPPFSIIGKVLAKIKQDEARGILIVPLWSTQPWFPIAIFPASIVKGKELEGSSSFARQKRDGTSTAQTSKPIGYFSFRSTLRGFELPEDTWALNNSSWRGSTKCQYNSALRKWASYYTERSVDSTSPTINDVLTLLTHLYDMGLSYSTNIIPSVKSVLSALIHIPGITKIAEHPLVKRLMTGIFNGRPTLPGYNFTWDTSIVINYLKGLNYDNLSHKLLSYKVAALLTILSGQRISTVHKFRLSQLHITKDIAIYLLIPSLLKHAKPGRVIPFINIRMMTFCVQLSF